MLDPTALRVMLIQAKTDLNDCYDRGDERHFREIADRAVSSYAAASRNARGLARIDLSPQALGEYAHQVVRELLAADARRR